MLILIVSKIQNEIIEIVKFKQNFEIHEFDNISKYVDINIINCKDYFLILQKPKIEELI